MPLTRLPPMSALRAFEAAARRGSFKEAADELSVTPGAISQQIKTLEADLGVKLFQRQTRSVSLTEEGRTLQTGLGDAFYQVRKAVDDTRASADLRLSINSTTAIISKWLLPRLHRFTREHGELQVSIETETKLNDMNEAGPDIVIRHTGSPPSGLFSKCLHKEILLPVASPDFVRQRNLTSSSDISGLTLLHDTSLTFFGLPSSWELWAAAAGLSARSGFSSAITLVRQGGDQAVDAAVAGAGFAVCRSLLASAALMDGRLTCPFGPVIPSGLSYYICCREGRENEPHIQAFMSWAEGEAAVLSTLNALAEPAAPD